MTRREFEVVKDACRMIASQVENIGSTEKMLATIDALTYERLLPLIDSDRPTDPVPHLMQGLGRTIEPMLPPKHGFMLFVFPFGDGGRMNYVASAERADCINALKEFLVHNGAAEDWMKHV